MYTCQERHAVDASIRALTRFGLGARIGEPESVGDPRQWLRAQLERAQPTLPGAELAEIASVLRNLREAQRAQDRERLRAIQRRVREIEAMGPRTIGQAYADYRPLYEELLGLPLPIAPPPDRTGLDMVGLPTA